jgi:hypothetical protein
MSPSLASLADARSLRSGELIVRLPRRKRLLQRAQTFLPASVGAAFGGDLGRRINRGVA